MMIVKDWFEGVIHEYEDVSTKVSNTEAQAEPSEPDSNESTSGTNWVLYLAGAAITIGGGYLAFNMMNK